MKHHLKEVVGSFYRLTIQPWRAVFLPFRPFLEVKRERTCSRTMTRLERFSSLKFGVRMELRCTVNLEKELRLSLSEENETENHVSGLNWFNDEFPTLGDTSVESVALIPACDSIRNTTRA